MLSFEPFECTDLKVLSLKTVLLLALTSAKQISQLYALSVHASCLQLLLTMGR